MSARPVRLFIELVQDLNIFLVQTLTNVRLLLVRIAECVLITLTASRASAQPDIPATHVIQVSLERSCMVYWNNVFLSTDVNECTSLPCNNGGTCVDGVNEYTCQCMAGYTGGDCQTSKCHFTYLFWSYHGGVLSIRYR